MGMWVGIGKWMGWTRKKDSDSGSVGWLREMRKGLRRHFSTAVAPLNNVVWQSGNDEAGKTAHRPSFLPRRWVSIACTVTVIVSP